MVLYINSCSRKDSRTDELAKELLKNICSSFKELKLENQNLLPMTQKRLNFRNEQILKQNYEDSMFDYAKEFANAKAIVISAPFWDLSFPSLLKLYIENIYVSGIVSKYLPNGKVQGLCSADSLFYVTTAGGFYDERFSFDYVKELCTKYFGIKNVYLIKAEKLDIQGSNVKMILDEAKEEIKKNYANLNL